MSNRKLNVLFIPTQASSVMWWRMHSWCEAAYRTGAANFCNPLWFKDLVNDHQPWQDKLTSGDAYDPMFVRAFIGMIESGAQQADAIVMQYPQTEGALELFDSLKHQYKHLPILTEIDDNIISIPAFNPAFNSYDPRGEVRERVIKQMRASDGLIVSTPYLKEIYSEYNKRITVIPNSIDFKRWGAVKRKNKGGVRIVWAGGSGHEGDFEPVLEPIKRITEAHKDAHFCFVNGPSMHGLPDALRNVERIEHKAVWKPVLKYPQLLADQDPDIIIAPLRDSAFNRAKSNLKWIEAAALGVPCVAAKVGHMAETVKHGEDGLLYETPEEFEIYLTGIINDRKLRNRIGQMAHERVRRDFNIDTNVFDYVKAIEAAIERKAVEPEPEDADWASNQIDLPKPEGIVAMQTVEMDPTESISISIQQGGVA